MKETFNLSKLLTSLRKDLKLASDPVVKESSARFFKEPVKSHGVKIPLARQIGKKYLAVLKSQSKATVFSVCEELWKSGMMEEAIIACMFSYSIRKQFEPGDFQVFEHWVSMYVTNWAACDTLCNHTVGIFLVQHPEYVPELKRWANDNNRWMRRGAAVSLIVPVAKGIFVKESLQICKILLKDTDDLIQKGYGWLLKSASEFDPNIVFEFVMKNKSAMPRTALRYAIEKMNPALKKEAMA